MRLTEASEQYCTVCQQDGYSPYTITAYRFQHHALIRDLVTTITLDDCRHHLAPYSHWPPASLGHKIRAIKSLFRWLADEVLWVPHLMRKLKAPHLSQRVPKAFTLDELEWLRKAYVILVDHALVKFFFATGCRGGEVHRLYRHDLSGFRQAVIVLGKGTQIGKSISSRKRGFGAPLFGRAPGPRLSFDCGRTGTAPSVHSRRPGSLETGRWALWFGSKNAPA